MIIIAYYSGLAILAGLMSCGGYLPLEIDQRLELPLGWGMLGFFAGGWYLFGWKIAFLNIPIFFTLGFIVLRIVRVANPKLQCRSLLSPEAKYIKLIDFWAERIRAKLIANRKTFKLGHYRSLEELVEQTSA